MLLMPTIAEDERRSAFEFNKDDLIKFKVLSDGESKVKTVIEIARVVDGVHPVFGRVLITKETLLSFKKNFDAKVFGKDISWDFDHDEKVAAGWPKSLELSEDGTRLLAVTDWTRKGFDALSNREYRYFSPTFSLNYIKSTTQEKHGPTLTGGALTNKPFLDMEAIVSLSLNAGKTKGNKKMDSIELSVHNAAISKKETEISDLKLSVNTLETEKKAVDARNEVLDAENKELKTEAALSEKTSVFETLLSEGKACEAQRESYIAGDMVKFAENAAKLNTKEKGTGKQDEDAAYKLSDAEIKICLDMGLTHDQYIKANELG